MIDLSQPLPNGWLLKDYQIKGINWLLANPRAILADDMGLGKTVQTLMATKCFRLQVNEDIPLIVIAPVSLLSNWKKEAKLLEVKDIHCYSWAKLPSILPEKCILVMDEAHYMKNMQSQRTQKALKLAHHSSVQACWLLSGTPMSNGLPFNLYPLLLAIKANFVYKRGGRSYYENTFCSPSLKTIVLRNKEGKIIERSVRQLGVNELALPRLSELTRDYILRRKKEDCLSLEKKHRIPQWIDLSSSEKKALNNAFSTIIEGYMARLKDDDENITHTDVVTAMTALRKLVSMAKVSYTLEMTEELLDQGESVVIFTKFIETADAIYAELSKSVPCELLTGKTPSTERGNKVESFQNGKSRVFVSTITAGGVGLTLTKANYLLMVDRDFLPEANSQAEDRCYRLGQTKPVFCYWLSVHDLDLAIDSLNFNKDSNMSIVLRDKTLPISTGHSDPIGLARVILSELTRVHRAVLARKEKSVKSLCDR